MKGKRYQTALPSPLGGEGLGVRGPLLPSPPGGARGVRLAPLLVAALCAVSTGCSTFLHATFRNLTHKTVESVDNLIIFGRNHKLAAAAWREVKNAHPEVEYSDDYAKGFKKGYYDYLEYGGNGEPPAVPPFRYRRSWNQNPEGYAAVLDWFAGFRHGSAVARESGYRELITVPLSSPPVNVFEDYPLAVAPEPEVPPHAEVPPSGVLPPPAVPVETLPPPRALPDEG